MRPFVFAKNRIISWGIGGELRGVLSLAPLPQFKKNKKPGGTPPGFLFFLIVSEGETNSQSLGFD
jgi:hypothetical protein